MRPIENINVRGIEQIISPNDLKREQPTSEAAAKTVVEAREAVKQILAGEDPRLHFEAIRLLGNLFRWLAQDKRARTRREAAAGNS